MRHQKRVKKVGVNSGHRRALMRNLCNDLFRHKRIVTTVAKAKAARTQAERLLSFAKRGDLTARRLLISRLGKQHLLSNYRHTTDKKEQQRTVIGELVDEIGPKLRALDEARKEKNPVYTGGGYTRILKLGRRKGDGAELAVLEIVGYEKEIVERRTKAIEEREAKQKRRMSLAERIKAKKEELQKK